MCESYDRAGDCLRLSTAKKHLQNCYKLRDLNSGVKFNPRVFTVIVEKDRSGLDKNRLMHALHMELLVLVYVS